MQRLKIQRRWPQGRRSLSAEDRRATQEAPRRQNRGLTSEQRGDGEELAGGGFELGEFCRKTELSQASLCLPQPLLAARGKGCPCTGVLSSCQQASASVSPSTLQVHPLSLVTAIGFSPSFSSWTVGQPYLLTASSPEPKPSPISSQMTPSEHKPGPFTQQTKG